MQNLFDKITHGQARVILLTLGVLWIVIGGILMVWAFPNDKNWIFNGGGVLLTIGVGVIALELSGQRRLLRMAFGFMVMAFGFFLSIPGVPGPGFVFVFLALAILAQDLRWAKDLMHRLNLTYHKTVEKMKKRHEEKKRPD